MSRIEKYKLKQWITICWIMDKEDIINNNNHVLMRDCQQIYSENKLNNRNFVKNNRKSKGLVFIDFKVFKNIYIISIIKNQLI